MGDGARAVPRSLGHRAGAKTVRRIVEAAPDPGIGMLTLYAFSRRQLAASAVRSHVR